MGLTCSKCNRTNPTDAAYCYFDGAVLDSRGAAAGGPVRAGAREFSNPFVFPSGEVCKTKLELSNNGMRLLYGSITAENCPWLTLGDGPARRRRCSSSAATRPFS